MNRDDGMVEPDWDAMEERLLRVLAQHSDDTPRAPVHFGRTAWSRWGSVAAVLVLAAAVTWYPVRPQPQAPPSKTTAPSAPSAPSAPAAPSAPSALSALSAPSAPRAAAPRRAVGKPARPAARIDPPDDAAAQFADFVALPEASGLPDFESGRILRVEVPRAALPAYGLHMATDAAPAAVEADLLVGQDGLPRAIRLAGAIQ